MCTDNNTHDFWWLDLLQKDETTFWHQHQHLLCIFQNGCIIQTKSHNEKWFRYVIWAQPEIKLWNTFGVLVNFSNHPCLFKELKNLGPQMLFLLTNTVPWRYYTLSWTYPVSDTWPACQLCQLLLLFSEPFSNDAGQWLIRKNSAQHLANSGELTG